MLQGCCHCGNIQLTIPALTEAATSCNCSICARYAAVWGYFTESEVTVLVGEQGISSYSHGDMLISFNRCANCGCVTHYTSTSPAPNTRLAVNYRMFAPSVLQQINIRPFDGADTWEYLE